MNDMKLSEAIAYLRRRAGYTQKDLAARIGISDKAVSKWERGIACPDLSYIAKLAVLLDTDTDSLLEGNMLPHGHEWAGLLVLPHNDHGIHVGTRVYGKPMVYFLLGYFLLMGIRDIYVSCDSVEEREILQAVGTGEQIGIRIRFFDGNFASAKRQLAEDGHTNFMVVFDRHFLYGVDQTKFFQRAMQKKNRLTVLSLPKQKKNKQLFYDSERKLVASDSAEKVYTAYNYGGIPILFCPKSALDGLLTEKNGRMALDLGAHDTKGFYTETLDRGYVDMPMNTWDEIADVSDFVRIVEKACGMELYCIEEIAWRRGLIDASALRAMGEAKANSPYGQYILRLCEGYDAVTSEKNDEKDGE